MNIIKISIAIVILGIFALFLIVRINAQNTINVSNLKEGQMERITGTINSVYVSGSGNSFFKVADASGEISVVAFNSSNIMGVYNLAVGDQVTVLGKVQTYKGSLEIIAKEIKKV